MRAATCADCAASEAGATEASVDDICRRSCRFRSRIEGAAVPAAAEVDMVRALPMRSSASVLAMGTERGSGEKKVRISRGGVGLENGSEIDSSQNNRARFPSRATIVSAVRGKRR